MAGYSDTPLPKKLGVKEGLCVAFHELPPDVKSELKHALKTCQVESDGQKTLDFAMVFVKTQAELKKHFAKYAKQLAPASMLWVSWPKEASGVATDLTEDEVRRIGLAAGLVDVKVCAVSEVWSGLKFVFRLKDRGK
jgi:hypothetical protein